MLTASITLKLLLTGIRYKLFKTQRQENIPAYLTNLIVSNLMLTAVFVKGNLMYFSETNLCAYVEDGLTKMSYQIFCALLVLGYL